MKLSIIVPIYNAEKDLNRCIESIIGQIDFNDIELILVNDGSKDRSECICKQYAKKYTNIRTYSHKNAGVSFTRNCGMDYAEGEYIWFVDADDYIEDGFLDSLLKSLRGGADIVMFSYIRENLDGVRENCRANSFSPEECLKELFYLKSDAAVWRFAFRRSLICDIRFDENIFYSEDALFLVDVMLKKPRLMALDQAGYHYTYNSNGAVRSKFSSKQLTIFDAIEKMENKLVENEISLLPSFYCYKTYFYYYLLCKMVKNKIGKEYFKKGTIWLKDHRRDFLLKKRSWKDCIKYGLLVNPISSFLLLKRFD